MNSRVISQSTLKGCHFEGIFSIDQLPEFGKVIPASYLIHIDNKVWYAIIHYNKDDISLFNPASNLVSTSPKLIDSLSYYANVTLVDCNINCFVDHMYDTCIYFILLYRLFK